MRLLTLPLLLAALAAVSLADVVEETYPDGALKARYAVDADGMRLGGYTEYFPSGKVKVRAQYRFGRLHGFYSTFHENGQMRVSCTYRDGRVEGKWTERDDKGRTRIETAYTEGEIDGPLLAYEEGKPLSRQEWKAGRPVDIDGVRPHPKSIDAIRVGAEAVFNTDLEATAVPPGMEKDPLTRGRLLALQDLMIFRLLCDVPHEGITLDAKMNEYALAAAKLCERIGRLDHTPENPGLPQEEYEFGYHGTSHSNLHMGGPVETSVRAYMDDSDPSNIDRVGHRRWCLNPRMGKAGFGQSGNFTAMYAHDSSRRSVPIPDTVHFPPRGYMPAYYFAPHYAWSIQLNPRAFDRPETAAVKTTIHRLDEFYLPAGDPLPLDYSSVSLTGFSVGPCVIFRPKAEALAVEPGARYRVTVEGLTKRGKPVPLVYYVEFFEL